MKRKLYFLISLAMAALVVLGAHSCRNGGSSSKVEITPIMNKALNDVSSIWYANFEDFPPKEERRRLPIGVFDSGTGGLAVLEVILASDYLDNINGESGADGVPDFHGEDFQYFADHANMPYGAYPSAGKADYLRELVVKDALFLLGNKYFKLNSDKTPKGDKLRCKILVVACNTSTAYGLQDIENLLNLSGTGVKVIGVINAGVDATFEDILSAPRRDSLSIGVMATVGTIDSDVYRRALLQKKKDENYNGYIQIINQKGEGFAEAIDSEKDYIDPTQTAPRKDYRGPVLGEGLGDIKEELLDVYNFDFSKNAILYKKVNGKYTEFQLNSAANYARFYMVSLLEQLRNSKEQAPLKSIVLGCTHYPFYLDTLKQSLKELKQYREKGQLIYSHLIADDVKFIDPAVFTAIECCKALRDDNLMALRTRRGEVDAFISMPSYSVSSKFLDKDGNFTRDYKYARVAGTEDITTVAVPFSRENISNENLKRIEKLVPHTYSKIKEKLK